MIMIEKEFLSMRGPTTVLGTRKGLGAIIYFATERCLHCHKTAFDVAVVMDEIFDSKLDFTFRFVR